MDEDQTQKQRERSAVAAAAGVGEAIFSGSSSVSFAEAMRDKVAAIHSHFDRDCDGFLNYEELRSLQLVTSQADMASDQYRHICTILDCDPNRGITLDALRLTYASDGTSSDGDYAKVFSAAKEEAAGGETGGEDGFIEVGEGGVDISF